MKLPEGLGCWRHSRRRAVLRRGRLCWRRGSGLRGRGRCRARRCSCFRWSRGSWTCRLLSGFGLLLTRREKRGTSQDADIFFHNGNRKGHIGLID